jgi:hypothetical protein
MTTRIILSDNPNSGSVPVASSLEQAELVINSADGRLFTKNASGQIVLLNSKNSNPISSSYAVTASFALNGGGGSAPPSAGRVIVQPSGSNGSIGWSFLGGTASTIASTAPLTGYSNTFRAVPFFAPTHGLRTITQVGFYRTNLVTSATLIFGIYSNRGHGNNHPDVLLGTGSIAMAGAGPVFNSTTLTTPVTMTPGEIYWFITNFSGSSNPSVTGLNEQQLLGLGYNPTAAPTSAGNRLVMVTSASTFSSAVFPPTITDNWTYATAQELVFPFMNGTL